MKSIEKQADAQESNVFLRSIDICKRRYVLAVYDAASDIPVMHKKYVL